MKTSTAIMFKNSRTYLLWLTIAAAVIFHVAIPPAGLATNGTEAAKDTATFKSNSTDPSGFTYQLENRSDPFVPFITEKATTSDIDLDEIIENNEVLTGMQLFEPGQLTLVALMKSGGKDVAMVEDVTGKGYVIEEGTKIGRRGVVIKIIPNRVVIEETAETRAGKKIVTETVMVLKKEGEE